MPERPDFATLLEHDQRQLHPYYHPNKNTDPLVVERAEGVWLHTADGRRVLDGLAGLWNVNAGYGRAELADAARDQMLRVAFTSNFVGMTTVPAAELAQRLAGFAHPTLNTVFFASGGSEANNLFIKGAAACLKPGTIAVSAIEHPCVREPALDLKRLGWNVHEIAVDAEGRVAETDFAAALAKQPALVSVMLANNETGVLQDIPALAAKAKSARAWFHTDAVQALGKIPIDVQALGIDLLSLTAHKIYGPKGIGGLYVRKKDPRVRLDAIIDGGGHERGMRSGTLAVQQIVGLAKACDLCREEMPTEAPRLIRLREKLRAGIMGQLSDVHLNGHPTERLPGNLNLSFAYVEGEGLLMGIKDIAVSSGSACTSASLEPSYVLKALGVGDELAHSSIRFGLGRFTTEEEIDYTIDAVVREVNRLRAMSPLYEMAQQGIDLSTVQWAAH